MKAHDDALTAKHTLAIWLLALISASGVALVLWLTRHGTGLYGDSIYYLEGARSIMEGHGYSVPASGGAWPITHWPPLFSCSLAAVSLFGVEPYVAARWLNALLLGVNIFLTGYIALTQGKPRWIAALCGALFLLGSWQFLLLHCRAMPEPLFITLFLFGILFLLRYGEAPSWGMLLFAASFFSLSFMTRFYALPLVAGGMLCVLLPQGSLRIKLLHAVAFGVASCSLILCFFLRNRLSTGHFFDMGPSTVVAPPDLLHNLLSIFPLWSWPPWLGFSWLTKAVVFLASAGLIVVSFASAASPRLVPGGGGIRLTHAVGLFLGCSLLFYMTMGLHMAYEVGEWSAMNRHLSPMIPLLALLIVDLLGQSRLGYTWRMASAVFGIISTCGCLKIGLAWIRGVERDGGIEYSRKMWRESETMGFIRRAAPDRLVWSNEPWALLHYARKTAEDLPWTFDIISGTNVSAGSFGATMGILQSDLARSGGWVVYFTRSEHSNHVTIAVLTNSLPLEPVASFGDGVVYRLAERREKAP